MERGKIAPEPIRFRRCGRRAFRDAFRALCAAGKECQIRNAHILAVPIKKSPPNKSRGFFIPFLVEIYGVKSGSLWGQSGSLWANPHHRYPATTLGTQPQEPLKPQ